MILYDGWQEYTGDESCFLKGCNRPATQEHKVIFTGDQVFSLDHIGKQAHRRFYCDPHKDYVQGALDAREEVAPPS